MVRVPAAALIRLTSLETAPPRVRNARPASWLARASLRMSPTAAEVRLKTETSSRDSSKSEIVPAGSLSSMALIRSLMLFGVGTPGIGRSKASATYVLVATAVRGLAKSLPNGIFGFNNESNPKRRISFGDHRLIAIRSSYHGGV